MISFFSNLLSSHNDTEICFDFQFIPEADLYIVEQTQYWSQNCWKYKKIQLLAQNLDYWYSAMLKTVKNKFPVIRFIRIYTLRLVLLDLPNGWNHHAWT